MGRIMISFVSGGVRTLQSTRLRNYLNASYLNGERRGLTYLALVVFCPRTAFSPCGDYPYSPRSDFFGHHILDL